MTRCARDRRVVFIEEPIRQPGIHPELHLEAAGAVTVVSPRLPADWGAERSCAEQRRMVDELLERQGLGSYLLWYYTPMALKFTDHLSPLAVVYDCMDELSAFKDAPAELRGLESALLRRADLVGRPLAL
jgi:UDP-galactopyranose mutase